MDDQLTVSATGSSHLKEIFPSGKLAPCIAASIFSHINVACNP
jgi:hypothetical protein